MASYPICGFASYCITGAAAQVAGIIAAVSSLAEIWFPSSTWTSFEQVANCYAYFVSSIIRGQRERTVTLRKEAATQAPEVSGPQFSQ